MSFILVLAESAIPEFPHRTILSPQEQTVHSFCIISELNWFDEELQLLSKVMKSRQKAILIDVTSLLVLYHSKQKKKK